MIKFSQFQLLAQQQLPIPCSTPVQEAVHVFLEQSAQFTGARIGNKDPVLPILEICFWSLIAVSDHGGAKRRVVFVVSPATIDANPSPSGWSDFQGI